MKIYFTLVLFGLIALMGCKPEPVENLKEPFLEEYEIKYNNDILVTERPKAIIFVEKGQLTLSILEKINDNSVHLDINTLDTGKYYIPVINPQGKNIQFIDNRGYGYGPNSENSSYIYLKKLNKIDGTIELEFKLYTREIKSNLPFEVSGEIKIKGIIHQDYNISKYKDLKLFYSYELPANKKLLSKQEKGFISEIITEPLNQQYFKFDTEFEFIKSLQINHNHIFRINGTTEPLRFTELLNDVTISDYDEYLDHFKGKIVSEVYPIDSSNKEIFILNLDMYVKKY